jgi:AraC-like DNA-binding protein
MCGCGRWSRRGLGQAGGTHNGKVPTLSRPPALGLGPLLARGYVGFSEPSRGFGKWLMPPAVSVTLIVNLEGAFGGLPSAFVAGLDDAYSVVEVGGSVSCLDVKMTPPGAYRLLGVPMSELTGRVVDLCEVGGVAGRRLADEVREASSWERRFDLLDHFLLSRAERGPVPTAQVTWALRRLLDGRGRLPVSAIAEEVGWSHRHLIAKFRQQIGLPPKALSRIVRFNELLRRIRNSSDRVSWTELAYECGYYDQAHLNRDFREFAGTTPSDFLARCRPAGAIVGDGVNSVQDLAGRRR